MDRKVYLDTELRHLSELEGSFRLDIRAGALVLLSCSLNHRFQELSKFLDTHSDLKLKDREWLEAEKEVLRSFLIQVDKLGVV